MSNENDNSDEWRKFIDTIKERCDLIELIAEDGFVLKQVGGCWRDCEGWPSLIAWANGTFKDFGGDRGGDCFSWKMLHEGWSFIEAAKFFAERYGVPMPSGNLDSLEAINEQRTVQAILSFAAHYYHNALPSKLRKHIRTKWSMTNETIDEYQVGWGASGLLEALRREGYTTEQILWSGLFIKSNTQVTKAGEPVLFPLFEDRITFPYWRRKRCRYMIGRRVEGVTGDEDWQKAKYKKLLTQTAKHQYVSEHVQHIFYNEDALDKSEWVLVTEGVTDCIAAHQAGIPCISPVTVRFSEKDVPKFAEMTEGKRIVVCNDAEPPKPGDTLSPGDKGALATLRKLFDHGRDIRKATLPMDAEGGKTDVCEYLAAHTGEELMSILHAAKRYPEFMLDAIPADVDPADVEIAIVPIIDLIANQSPMQQELYVNLIATRFKTATKRTLKAKIKERKRELAAIARKEAGGDASEETRHRISGQVERGTAFYFTRDREGNTDAISSFLIEPTQRVQVDDIGEMITANIHTDKGQVIEGVTLPPNTFTTRRQLVSTLNKVSADLQWTGSDNQVQGLLRDVASTDVPVRSGSQTIGWFETPDGPRWIGPKCAIGPDGIIDSDEFVYVDTQNPIARRLEYREESASHVLKVAETVLPRLPKLNTPSVMAPLIGWYFAAPFASPIRKQLSHFPILWNWGSQGSGKSSLAQLFWQMQGVKSAEPFSATETAFSMLRLLSGTNGVPINIDEYKLGDMAKRAVQQLSRFARRSYAGEVESRGRPDLSITSYALIAPLCVTGEQLPDEPAIRERILSASPNKAQLERNTEARQAFAACRLSDLGALAVPYLKFALSRDVKGDLEWARNILAKALEGVTGADKLPARVVDNLTVMVFGLIQWEAFAESLGVPVEAFDLAAAVKVICGDMLESDGGSKDALDHFLESCSVLAHTGKLEAEVHYTIIGTELRLHLPSAHAVYVTERHRAGLPDVTNGLRALRRVAREKHDRGGYIAKGSEGVERRTPMGKTKVRCLAVNLATIPESLDIDAFPVGDQRGWGGKRWADGGTDDE